MNPVVRYKSVLATIGLLLLLAGCAGAPTPPSELSWEAHRQQVEAFNAWRAEGKLAMRSPEQSESGAFNWRQDGQRVRLEISGPLGINSTILESDGRQVEIRQGDERSTWELPDPQTLARHTGWQLPLQALPYWLRGIPSPHLDMDALELENQRLATLRQAGWQLSCEDYGSFAGTDLPTRLLLRRGDLSLRIIVRRWHRGSAR